MPPRSDESLDDVRAAFLGALKKRPAPPRVIDAVKQKIIGEYIKTPSGRSKLAAMMTAPLRARMNYNAVASSVFGVQQLPDGALPIYDRGYDGEPEEELPPEVNGEWDEWIVPPKEPHV